ncbi:MAG: lipoyl domain-containing protein [Bacteroidales bacterium]|nr:lipoyl domain-containing protein [Bacteroidales bacterium]
MTEPIPLPDLGSPTARVSLWHVRPGERVYAGDRLVEVLIPGTLIDIPAPVTGTVLEWLAFPQDTLHPGDSLGSIDADPYE